MMKGRFIGECDALKNCIFDCSETKVIRPYDRNLKKISIYVGSKVKINGDLSVMIEELVEL
jgi:hypothetical protein